MSALLSLEEQLGHVFQDKSLLDRALTHASFSPKDNQRLEFLGDACLGFVVADMLMASSVVMSEGDLTRLRAKLVNKSSLVVLARTLSLQKYIKVGENQQKTITDKILADALEALVAALYLDAGWEAVRVKVACWYRESFADVLSSPEVAKDAKTRLQEYCHARKQSLPEYRLLETSGLDGQGQTEFYVAVSVQSQGLEASGKGRTKRAAEMDAAQQLLNEQGE